MISCEDLRCLALALPEAYEQDHFGRPSFRVAKKIFVTCAPELARITIKLDPNYQEMLFEVRPDAFSRCVWGRIVCTYVQLDRIDNSELAMLLKHAWRQVAPKALIKAQDHA